MALNISTRMEGISQSEIRGMTLECNRLGGVNLAQGVCNTGVPPVVVDGVRRAIADGFNTYTRYDGLPALRESIAEKMWRDNGIRADPETEVVVSAGSTGAFYCACMALLDPGDEVILFEPYYGYHVNMIRTAGGVPCYVRMTAPGWTFSAGDLERVVTPRTRAIVVCTPGNPSGKVYTGPELRMIAEFAVRHDLFVFTDEIYEYFLYDGCRHISPATLPGMAGRTLTISGYSKTFSITGWRIGYTVCAARWAGMIGYANDLVYVCAPAPLQMGVAAGIRGLDASFYLGLRDEFDRKRGQLCDALAAAGLTPHVPQGAYYVLADASRLPGRTSKERAMGLLHKTGVAGVPGSAFYHDEGGENLIRFCFAKPDGELDEACRRLKSL